MTPTPIASAVTPLSIASVSPAWPADGQANGVVHYVSTIAGGLRQEGHRAFVLAHRVTTEDAWEDVHDLSASATARTPARRILDGLLYRIAPTSGMSRQACRSIVAGARKAAIEHGAQLLEMEESFGWPLMVKPKIPIPIVVRLHGPWFVMGPLRGVRDDAEFRWRVRREGEAIRLADGVTATSRDILERTRSYYGLALEDAEVIPNPAPIVPESECWRLANCESRTILFIGRFDRHKGGDVLIDAFAHLATEFPEARLRFVGPDMGLDDEDGRRWSITDYLRARITDAGVAGRVEWMGQLPSTTLRTLRRQAIVTVVSSRYENCPTTVLEAMSQGCPLVASDTGGIPEMITDGANGLLSRPGDPADLAAKLGRLLRDPDLADRLGRRARHDCEAGFSPTAIARRMAAFYRRVIDRARSDKN